MSAFQGVRSPNALQQEVNRRNTMVKQHNMWINTAMDEFKLGFPSDGLSTVTNQWWGCKEIDKSAEEDKLQSKEEANDGAESMDVGVEEQGGEETNEKVRSEGSDSLVAIRKRIAEEGREALQCGRRKGYGSKKIGRRDKALLVRIFGSSLPKEWVI